jgi:hypothetical protein
MFKNLFIVLVLILLVGLLAACTSAPIPAEPTAVEAMPMDSSGMDMKGMSEAPAVPAGLAYADGQEIRFIHTEASDSDVADLLSDMMASPVIYVPSLGNAPDSILADVYVFKNGVAGMGPLGFQPDVFDNLPGTDGYSPLRRIIFVTWADETKARELKSLAEVIESESKGELALEESNVVVNMPFITWPDGHR